MMATSPFQRMYEGIREGDLPAVRQALLEKPDLLNMSVYGGGTWLHFAATFQSVAMVELLVNAGIRVNAPTSAEAYFPINYGISENRLDVVRWLLDHGANLNPQDGNAGKPLISAINSGSLEMVRLLLERGADPNVVFATEPKHALSHALACGRQDMADLLRAAGAKEPTTGTAGQPGPLHPEIVRHFGQFVGPVRGQALVEIVLGSPPVAVHIVPAGPERNYITLFTAGMSARAMTVPSGSEAFQYAEVQMRLPSDWPLDAAALADANNFWPIRWLRQIARYPHDHNTWLGGASTIVSNGEPPQPLASNTQLSCVLLLIEPEPFGKVIRPEGGHVNIYSAYPIYTGERALEQREGVLRLLDLFQEHGISRVVDLHRPNMALGR